MASINSHRPPSSTATFLLGIVCLAAFATIIVVWTKSESEKVDPINVERATARVKKREELEKDWAGKLQTVAWINKEKGEVQLPIDDAIKVVAAELKQKKVAKTEVKVPAIPPPPVVDPKSTEPPPLPLPSSPQGADLIHFSDPFAPAPAVAPVAAPAAVPAIPAPAPPVQPAAPAPSLQTPTPASVPAPAIPAPAIPPATPDSPNVAATAPSRPPLINWTESK